jgi:ParB family transcriptional regulator, chromosome partitioning protein
MPLDLVDLDALDLMTPDASPQPATADASSSSQGHGAGAPLLIPIDDIDEDPEQPRTEFEPQALQQLADTIGQRGVRQPISVRPHPRQPQRWIVNFGSRRLRASTLAGKTHIPAFVDASTDSYDQVIENEQREGLKPLELALFVQRRMALGETQAFIAKGLGKSQPYIAYACALIDAPDWLMGLYRQGKCQGLTELYHLRRLHSKAPDRVSAWAASAETITRSDVQVLKRELGDSVSQPGHGEGPGSARGPATVTSTPKANHRSTANPAQASSPANVADLNALRRAPEVVSRGLFARRGTELMQIVLDDVPAAPGEVFVRKQGELFAESVAASDLQLLGFRLIEAT